MNRQKYLELIFEKGLSFGPRGGTYLTESYEELVIPSSIRSLIKSNFESKSDFEIPILEFSEIKKAINKRIEKLLKHPEFDPFKEELRKKFPEQYGSNPFIFNGKTYYLYGKTMPIDSDIERATSFLKLIDDHEKENTSLKFKYKE